MSDKTFIDTNILVYAHDLDDRSKHECARNALRELWNDGTGLLSPQVLQEFYVNVTRKIAKPLAKDVARMIVSAYAIWCVDVTSDDIGAAFRIEDAAKIGFWDALIIASAAKAGATRLLSEDLNAGQTIAGVLVENPFASLRP
jgi:predicted nucleic acid-binding protein